MRQSLIFRKFVTKMFTSDSSPLALSWLENVGESGQTYRNRYKKIVYRIREWLIIAETNTENRNDL